MTLEQSSSLNSESPSPPDPTQQLFSLKFLCNSPASSGSSQHYNQMLHQMASNAGTPLDVDLEDHLALREPIKLERPSTSVSSVTPKTMKRATKSRPPSGAGKVAGSAAGLKARKCASRQTKKPTIPVETPLRRVPPKRKPPAKGLTVAPGNNKGMHPSGHPVDADRGPKDTGNAVVKTLTHEECIAPQSGSRTGIFGLEYQADLHSLPAYGNASPKSATNAPPASPSYRPLLDSALPPTPEALPPLNEIVENRYVTPAELTYSHLKQIYRMPPRPEMILTSPNYMPSTTILDSLISPATSSANKENELDDFRETSTLSPQRLDRAPLQTLALRPSPPATPSPVALGIENIDTLLESGHVSSELPDASDINQAELADILEKGFWRAGQLGCRFLASAWIKLISPHKRVLYPYRDGEAGKPPWWSNGVPHIQPGHLCREDRIKLLVDLTLRFNHLVLWLRMELMKSTSINAFQMDQLDQCLILSQQWMSLNRVDELGIWKSWHEPVWPNAGVGVGVGAPSYPATDARYDLANYTIE